MTTTAQRIDECIAANEAAQVDTVSRSLLDSLSDRLRRYRCRLSSLNADEQALYAGENWAGPALDDLIRESQWHRNNGAAKHLLAKLDGDLSAARERLGRAA